MSMRTLLALLVTLTGFVLMYFGAHETGAMLAGGGPCLIIINEGGRAYGVIEAFKITSSSETAPLAKLEAAVLTSCSLVQFGATEKRFDGEYLEGPVLGKIGDFHANLIENLGQPDYDISHEAKKLEKYNRKLANLIEPGTYPNE